MEAAPEVDQGGGGHGGGRADLRLTAALGPGDGGPGGDDHSEAGGHIQGLDQLLPGEREVPGAGEEHRGQHAAGPRRGGGHDALHAGVALPHPQSPGHHLGEKGAAQGVPGGVQGHFGPVTPRQAAVGAVLGLIALVRLHHGVQHGPHPLQRAGAGQVLPPAVGFQNVFPEGQAELFRILEHLGDGVKGDQRGTSCSSGV